MPSCQFHGKLTMRTVCVLTAGSSPATLDNRLSTPLVVAQPPAELKTQRANTYVARLTLDRAYCGDSWEKILKSPGKFARTWIGALGIAQLAIVDTFGFAQVGNLIYFVDIIGSNRDVVLKEDVAVTWVPWQPDETYVAYRDRVCREAKLGLVLGRGLGQRVLASDPAYKKQPTVWWARAAPENS